MHHHHIHDIHAVLAMAIAVVGGQVFISGVGPFRPGWLPARAWSGHAPSLSEPLGAVERVLYVSALLIREPILLGVWLAVKMLGVAPWNAAAMGASNRLMFQRSLILSGLSLVWAGVGWRCAFWLATDDVEGVVAGCILAAGASLAVGLWMRHLQPGIRQATETPGSAGGDPEV